MAAIKAFLDVHLKLKTSEEKSLVSSARDGAKQTACEWTME
jgi:hypothetical protein